MFELHFLTNLCLKHVSDLGLLPGGKTLLSIEFHSSTVNLSIFTVNPLPAMKINASENVAISSRRVNASPTEWASPWVYVPKKKQ